MRTGTAPGSGSHAEHSTVKRTRAPAACTVCRSRRTKCIVQDGASRCTYCIQSKLQCIIPNDDERKRPTSKAYVSALTARIELLESMLQELGQTPPPMDAGATSHPGQAVSQAPSRGQKRATVSSGASNTSTDAVDDEPEIVSLRPELVPLRDLVGNEHLIHRSVMPDSWKPNTPLQAVTQTLTQEEQDHLMDLYWNGYNSVVNLVSEADFRKDHEAGKCQWYSEFLHVCLMAMGSRFASSAWPGRRKIVSGERETLVHKKAKVIFESGGEKLSGLPMVQALIILGDLECGVGRLESGWMYSRRACELMFALDQPLGDSSPEAYERSMRHQEMVLWVCIVYDQFWTIFFNRPTGIKDSDLLSCQINNRFGSLSISRLSTMYYGPDHDKYEAMADLTRLTRKVIQSNTRNIDEKRFSAIASLDGQLKRWCNALPERLAWMPENSAIQPLCYFLLHQHYHAALILLHWHPAQYTTTQSSSSPSPSKPPSTLQLVTISRKACLDSALQLANVLKQGRLRFATRQLFVTCLQNVIIAAAALVASTTVFPNPHSYLECLQSLQDLVDCLEDMAQIYQPAEGVSKGLSKFIQNPVAGLKALTGTDSCFANTMFAFLLATTVSIASQEQASDTPGPPPAEPSWGDTYAFIADDNGMAQIVAHATSLETRTGDTLDDVDSFLAGHVWEPRDH